MNHFKMNIAENGNRLVEDGFASVMLPIVIVALALSPFTCYSRSKLEKEEVANVAPSASSDSNWTSYNKLLDGQRYSRLDEINVDTAKRLREHCRVVVNDSGSFPGGLLFVGGTIFLAADRVTEAIDSTTCRVIWQALWSPKQKEVLLHNRGLAYLNGVLYRGTGDARLLAYDALSGSEKWEQTIGDPLIGEFVPAAPIAWEGLVFVGTAGGGLGVRGRVMAFDASTGEMRWTFSTVPQPGEFGHSTWSGMSWQRGGGATWSSYTLDPATGELFVPVDNPAPDFYGAIRRGDNLFTDSVVVLDAKSGRRLWHVQLLKHDTHDYGLASPPVLVDRGTRRLLVQGSKDGFLYFVDRVSHRVTARTPTTTILNQQVDPTLRGMTACPGSTGGLAYNSPGYDPAIGILILGSVDWCGKLFLDSKPPSYKAGEAYVGGRAERLGDGTGWLMAVDLHSLIRWKKHVLAPVVAAITPTAGGVTFAGDAKGTFYVIRSADGEFLLQIKANNAIVGGIITYQVAGKQYVATASGGRSPFSSPEFAGKPSLVVYCLSE